MVAGTNKRGEVWTEQDVQKFRHKRPVIQECLREESVKYVANPISVSSHPQLRELPVIVAQGRKVTSIYSFLFNSDLDRWTVYTVFNPTGAQTHEHWIINRTLKISNS